MFNSSINNALTRANKVEITEWGVPAESGMLSLTIGASGATYTAPATGFVVLDKRATGNGQYMNSNPSICGTNTAPQNGFECWTTLFVKKGQTFKINYTTGGVVERFSLSKLRGVS